MQAYTVRIQELSPFLLLPPPIPQVSDVAPTTELVSGETPEIISRFGSPDHLRELLVIQTHFVPLLLDKYLNRIILIWLAEAFGSWIATVNRNKHYLSSECCRGCKGTYSGALRTGDNDIHSRVPAHHTAISHINEFHTKNPVYICNNLSMYSQ